MSKETFLEHFQGADHRFVFTVLNKTETAAIDISGWALSWMVKRNKGDADASALLTKTTTAGIVISGVFNVTPSVNTQVATVTVDDTDTTALAAGVYHHELKRTDPSFEVIVSTGQFSLIRGVHR